MAKPLQPLSLYQCTLPPPPPLLPLHIHLHPITSQISALATQSPSPLASSFSSLFSSSPHTSAAVVPPPPTATTTVTPLLLPLLSLETLTLTLIQTAWFCPESSSSLRTTTTTKMAAVTSTKTPSLGLTRVLSIRTLSFPTKGTRRASRTPRVRSVFASIRTLRCFGWCPSAVTTSTYAVSTRGLSLMVLALFAVTRRYPRRYLLPCRRSYLFPSSPLIVDGVGDDAVYALFFFFFFFNFVWVYLWLIIWVWLGGSLGSGNVNFFFWFGSV